MNDEAVEKVRTLRRRIEAWWEACEEERAQPPEEQSGDALDARRRQLGVELARLQRQ